MAGNFENLNEYLDFEIKAETNIDKYTQKVACKKSSGDLIKARELFDIEMRKDGKSMYIKDVRK